MPGAYCNGCGLHFFKTHSMMNHRRTDRCGGRFLDPETREVIEFGRAEREAPLREARTARLLREATYLPGHRK